MAKMIAVTDKLDTVRSLVATALPKIENMIPRYLATPGAASRLVGVFMQEIPRNPDLLECTQQSLLGAFMTTVQLGLELGGTLGQAYLIPYKIHGVMTCNLIVGYRGFIALVERSGKVSTVQAHVVRAGDEHDFALGSRPFIKHKPKPLLKEFPSREAAEKALVAAYCVVRKVDGGRMMEWLWRSELLARRDRGRAKKGPWYGTWQDFEAMCRKTPTRSLLKYASMSSEVQRAVGLDEAAEDGREQDLEAIVVESKVIESAPAGTRKAVDKIADELEKRRETSKAPALKRAGKGSTKADKAPVRSGEDEF